MEIFLLIVFGIVSGVSGGMGMGGGTLLIPLLTIFLSINQKLAQGYNLIAFLIMAVFALIIHSKNKMIDIKSVILLDVFGVAFCVLGALLVSQIKSNVLHTIFAIFLILLSLYQFYKFFKKDY
ncbi:MAG: sulfite exporter TauE/SafE family protein [Clostridia bacterium]|nr:sulfite exporter TauE/SafE family protein [Clostridia bacterium]MDD3231770.1 sulfite exporter TauE/SafE family protein [Clostridia bacterium]